MALSGLGVASFHPEGARFANQVSGDRRGQGMSFFSLGGNAGFALGPILVTPLVLILGLHGTLLLAVIPTIVAVVLARELGRLRAVAAEKSAHVARSVAAEDDRDEDDWNAFVRLGGVVALRSCVYFGLQAFIPLWFIHQLGTGEGAGNAALTAMLVAGAVGTYFGGRVVDRLGRRRLVVGSTAAQRPGPRRARARAHPADGGPAHRPGRLPDHPHLLDHRRHEPGVPAQPPRASPRA